mgnify:FL=1|nr:MAG TPA: hypothetical protein [Caudoviricetes sp.]
MLVNGKITAPVSIDDVKRALGESSDDLATLCNNDGIVPWSRCKPIAYSQPFTDIPPVREDRTINVTSYYGAPCIVRCGILVPEIKYDVNNFNAIFDIAERLDSDNTWGNRFAPSATYNGYHLHGGTSEPYRLGDFRNYCNNASKTFAINTPNKTIHKIYNTERTMSVVLYEDMSTDDHGYSVLLENMFQNLYEYWSLYLCVRYGTDKNCSLIKVSDVNKNEYYVYAKGDVVFTNDDVYIVPCLIPDKYEAGLSIVILDSPGRILWEYKPRVINIYKIKSGNQDWEIMDDVINIENNEIMLLVEISKTSSSKTFANGQFKCTAHYINDTKTVISYGDITNSIGQKINVFTVPVGNENDKVQCYLKFTGVHENPKIGTNIYFDFEWYDDDTYKWNRVNGYCYGIVRN